MARSFNDLIMEFFTDEEEELLLYNNCNLLSLCSNIGIDLHLKLFENIKGNGCLMTHSSASNSSIFTHFYREKYDKSVHFLPEFFKKNNEEFFKQARVTKATFNFIFDSIKSNDAFSERKHPGKAKIDCKLALLATLFYLGNQMSYIDISKTIGLSNSSLYKYVMIVINILNEMAPRFISWPSCEEMPLITEDFKKLSLFPGIIGAIGTCHINVRSSLDNPKEYMNKLNKQSVILMAVCDPHKKFRFIFSGFRGSANTQQVFNQSILGQKLNFDYNKVCYSDDYHLVGDNGFKLKRYLMTPFIDSGDLWHKQLYYNLKHSAGRKVIDETFFLLKTRFRRMKFIEADVSIVSKIINAACILHNIALDSEMERNLLQEELFANDPPEEIGITFQMQESLGGIKKREKIMNSLTSDYNESFMDINI